ncbi:unnamed protein product [Owenia fusiformis]|uniref:Uncharacterized protein n=1 Tax=Owenia fusiformis TaxID=6347 RepID=A0A8J1UFH0_OWEFU|nr:unnamed protein product [Owenia fusiformis]
MYVYSASIVPECGYEPTGQLFMSDDHSPCVYHWCAKGKYLGKAQCAPGSAVPYGYMGTNNPCIINTKYCGLNRGHLFYNSDVKYSYKENGQPVVHNHFSHYGRNKLDYKDGDSYSQGNSYYKSSGYSIDEHYSNDEKSPKVDSHSFSYSKKESFNEPIADDYPTYPHPDAHRQAAHAHSHTQQYGHHRSNAPPQSRFSHSGYHPTKRTNIPDHIIQQVVEKLLSEKKSMKRDDHYHDRHKKEHDDGSYEKRRYRKKRKPVKGIAYKSI